MKFLLLGLIAYFIGNISTAYIMGKLIKKSDIRTMGSGNAGATNALRVYGKWFGITTLVVDLLKGVLAVYIGNRMLGYEGKLLASVCVVLGHDWPILLGFKGGKGIATSLGVVLALSTPTALVTAIIALTIIIVSKYVSLGSVIGAGLIPFVGLIFNRPFEAKFFFTTLTLALIAIYKHRENIVRLKEGRESKLGEKHK